MKSLKFKKLKIIIRHNSFNSYETKVRTFYILINLLECRKDSFKIKFYQ